MGVAWMIGGGFGGEVVVEGSVVVRVKGLRFERWMDEENIECGDKLSDNVTW
jgi:hypothetical protein